MPYDMMSSCADLTLTAAIEDLAGKSNHTKDEIRKALMLSEAYDCLYDFDTGLWKEGPAYFIDFYKRLESIKSQNPALRQSDA